MLVMVSYFPDDLAHAWTRPLTGKGAALLARTMAARREGRVTALVFPEYAEWDGGSLPLRDFHGDQAIFFDLRLGAAP